MSHRLFASSLVLAVLLSGCTQLYSVRPGELKPALATVAPEQRLAVWRRAVTILLDQGYVPQVLNESAGFISARRREDIANDALAGTMALVVVSPEGALRIELSGSGFFNSEQQFLSAIGERQSLLLSLMLR